MALTIIDSARTVREFIVYDLEWVPGTLEVRLVGVYDGKSYRCYRTIEEFVNGELTSENRNKWFYAHAGGLYDVQWVMEYLVRRLLERKQYEISVKCAFSGSSAIITKVRRGKNAWHFIDSYWLLRDKLANIGNYIGMEKGAASFEPTLDPEEDGITEGEYERRLEVRRNWFATVSFAELREYNERDCMILYHAINEFQNELLELGGQLQMTVASCAMQLFRRKYLTKPINTNPYVNECAQQSYTASRVETFCKTIENSNYYDINSSFPYAMTFPCPGELLRSDSRLPDNEDDIYIADVEIEVPDAEITPLPYRCRGRVFFPVGKWRTWLTSIDCQLLEQEGGKILKVFEVLHFEPFHDLRHYSTDVYELRRKDQEQGNLFKALVKKYVLNSLYGKFAEHETKSSLLINPDTVPITFEQQQAMGMRELFPGAWIHDYANEISHRHVPIASHITAIGRRTLYRYLSESRDRHYCDTDGFSTTENWGKSDDRLGALKLEKIIRNGRFDASKFYLLDADILQKDGSLKRKQIARGKGFHRLTPARYMRLMEGETIDVERQVRIRELYQNGEYKPREYKGKKGVRLMHPLDPHFRPAKHTLAKRMHYGDGSSRPWHVEEIEGFLSKENAA